MSAAAQLIERLRAQRDSWCVLREAGDGEPELAVCLRRPTEAELPAYRPAQGQTMHQLLTDAVCRTAVGWRGFTEAELLGAAIGSSDPLEFSADLWAEAVRDRVEWVNACAGHLMEQINRHLEAKAERQKN